MGRPVALVVVGTCVALAGTAVWVPIRHYDRGFTIDHGEQGRATVTTEPWESTGPWWPPHYRWSWGRWADVIPGEELNGRGTPDGPAFAEQRVVWPILLIEQAVILLLGGGLLTFVVRRERRRRAAVA